MAIASNFPAIKPSLLLDFANTKKLDSRITFTRTTTATYYDGVTTAKAEENLLLQSQDFATTWTVASQNATITSNTTTAPDGTLTADTLTDNATSGVHRVAQTITTSNNNQLVLSCFLKYSTMQWVTLSAATNTGQWAGAKFDVQNGVLGSTSQQGTGWTADSSSITSVGSGWYRCVLVFTPGNSGSLGVYVNGATDGTTFTVSQRGSEVYAGTGSEVFIWGAQLEQRSSVSSYTATTTQPITNYIPVLLTAASGVPRFDHNPTTDESLGLLIEEQRTNLQTYSSDFSNAVWTTSGAAITTNTIVAPDGTLTGDKLVEDTATSTHGVIGSLIGFTLNQSYTLSVYAKAGERSAFRFFRSGPGGASASFDLITLTTTALAGSPTMSMVNVGNGWYRCTMSWSASATANRTHEIRLENPAGTDSYTGDGYSGIYIWGAQLEAGAFPTSYIATTAATVTRNADLASMTGTNFSSWYRADEGTAQCIFNRFGTTSTPYPLGFSAGATPTTSPRISLRTDTSMNIQTQGVDAANIGWSSGNFAGSPGFNAVANAIMAWSFATRSAAGCVNGNAVTSATASAAAQMPVTSTLFIGSIGQLNGHIRKIAYYPLRLTDAQLQALTS